MSPHFLACSVRCRTICARVLALCASMIIAPQTLCAQTTTLKERIDNSPVYHVELTLEVVGKLRTAIGAGKAAELDLKVRGDFQYREQQIPGSGRDALALRSLRHYDRAQARIDVSRQTSSPRLRENRRTIVAQGQREGPLLFSPDGPLTDSELTLIQVPCDSLAVLGLLPETPVGVGATWKPKDWVLQMLGGIEAVQSSELSCRLEALNDTEAQLSFEGRLEGAVLGASTKVTVSGSGLFDVKHGFLRQVQMTQTEKRMIGAASPGMQVTARVTLKRSPASGVSPFDRELVAGLPLEPSSENLLLQVYLPWNTRCTYERSWHLFHQTSDVVVLRLVDEGSLIAQCNLSSVPSVLPGQHTSDAQFLADIRTSLGDKLKKVERSGELKTRGNQHVSRVLVVGESDGIPMNWVYYLCTAPSGRQVSLVFAVEPEMLQRLQDRDIELIKRLEFLEVNPK